MRAIMTSSLEGLKTSNPRHRFSNLKSSIPALNRILSVLLPITLFLSLCPQSALASQRVWEKSFELGAGGHVSVVNVHGSLLIEGWDRSEIEATVAMRGETSAAQLDDVQVAVEATHHGVAFHTLYPSGIDTPIRVDYRLRVPRQVLLDELSTLQGDIVVHNIDGSLNARNLHGDIEGVNVAGSVEAHTLTGNIMVSLRALPDRHQPVTLAAINGNVDLQLPAQANANLSLSTVAGSVVSDYPYQVSSTPGDSTRHAQVGTGGVQVSLRTVRGNIRVGQREEEL
jgi:hypothetical protein